MTKAKDPKQSTTDPTTEVATADANVPAVLDNSLFGQFAMVANDPNDVRDIIEANLGDEPLDVFILDRIKVPAGGATVWTIPTADGGEGFAKEIDAVIVASFITRSYWTEAYGKTDPGPPECYSTNGITGKGNPGGQCSTCPMAEFGTADNGHGAGQACSKKQVLFLLTKDDHIMPKMLHVPPASLKDAQRHMLRLLNAGLAKHHTVTRLTLVKDKSKGGIDFAKIAFSNIPESMPKAAWPAIDAYVAQIGPALSAAMDRLAQARDDYSGEEQRAAA